MIFNVKGILEKRGISPQMINDNVMRFSNDGLNYVFEADFAEDTAFFRMILPDVEKEEINDAVYKKMVSVSSNFKLGKCIEVNGQVWLTAEAFAYDKESLDVLVFRMMNLLSSMIKNYRAYGEKEE